MNPDFPPSGVERHDKSAESSTSEHITTIFEMSKTDTISLRAESGACGIFVCSQYGFEIRGSLSHTLAICGVNWLGRKPPLCDVVT